MNRYFEFSHILPSGRVTHILKDNIFSSSAWRTRNIDGYFHIPSIFGYSGKDVKKNLEEMIKYCESNGYKLMDTSKMSSNELVNLYLCKKENNEYLDSQTAKNMYITVLHELYQLAVDHPTAYFICRETNNCIYLKNDGKIVEVSVHPEYPSS
jgi:hypothetical protein